MPESANLYERIRRVEEEVKLQTEILERIASYLERRDNEQRQENCEKTTND